MRSNRSACAIALAGFVAGTCGCSGGNAVPSQPVARGAGASSAYVSKAARGVKITEYRDLPREPNGYFPTALTVGPDGAIWVGDDIDQDFGPSAVARIVRSGTRTNTYYHQADASPTFEGIATGPDGALWLTDWGDNEILRVTTSGTMTSYSQGVSAPEGIVAAPDGALWFANGGLHGGSIGRITTAGVTTIYTKGISQDTSIQDIAVGSDGALWFTEPQGGRIGRITLRGKVSEYSKGITYGASPYSIAAGPDGALWFTEAAAGRIGRITTKGNVTVYVRGITPSEKPSGITASTDNAMWFTENEPHGSSTRNAKIGRITMTGTIAEYTVPDSTSNPTAIVQAPTGDLWFVETNANRMGRIKPSR